MKGYLLTCTFSEATQRVLEKLADAHLYEQIHVYSLRVCDISVTSCFCVVKTMAKLMCYL